LFSGAHVVICSKDAERDRAFFRDVLGFNSVDAGHGWLIFKLPEGEAAFHPGDNDQHSLYLMCDDLKSTMAELKKKGVACGDVHSAGWGEVTSFKLPGGGTISLYQPRHARP
jgi:catechol 2,3-dioxygenase-like lactoylglutathione lyase family enzyme